MPAGMARMVTQRPRVEPHAPGRSGAAQARPGGRPRGRPAGRLRPGSTSPTPRPLPPGAPPPAARVPRPRPVRLASIVPAVWRAPARRDPAPRLPSPSPRPPSRSSSCSSRPATGCCRDACGPGGCWLPASSSTPRGTWATCPASCSSSWPTTASAWPRPGVATRGRPPRRPSSSTSSSWASSSTSTWPSAAVPRCVTWLTGQPVDWGGLGLVLPVAISFVSFTLIAYVVDVYRGRPARA